MSTAAAKKKKQAAPALATTGRGAAFCIALGIVMLTMGMMLLISLLWGNYSHVLGRLNAALQGLGGTLCLPLPLFFCWAGIKLLVSTRHKVSVRDILIFFLLYLMVLAGYTLLAQVSDNNSYISYMDYVGKRNARQAMAAPESFSAYLQQAFAQKTHGPGGLLGMLVAYPVWMVLGRIVGFIFILALSVVLIFLLLRANPGELMRKISDSSEQMRQRRLQRQQERMAAEQTAQPAPPVQDAASPLPPLQPGQTVRREETAVSPSPYYQAAPIYQAAPARPVADDSFYPVQPDLYDQRYPLHNHKENTPPPSPAWTTAPQQEEVIPPPDPIYPDVMAPTEETADPVQEETIPAPGPLSAVPLDDEVPWDEPAAAAETEPLIPAPDPVPVSAPVQAEKAAQAPRREAPVPKAKEAPLPKTDPIPQEKEPTAPTSWATQVRRKQAEIEMPEHTTAKGDPKPVYTDPVMPITGERIPITRKSESKPENSRLDGTPPKIHQTQMNMALQYQAPPIRLLNESRNVPQADAKQEDERRAQVIESTLSSFGVESQVKQIMHGPSITRFAIQIAPGVKVSRVTNTADNLALELKTKHVRVEAPIQGTSYIGIEVPNALVSTVSLREVLDSPEMQNNPSPLLVALGKDIAGTPILCDLSKMPHLLIAGATGSGKSVCINSIVCSLLYRTSPDQGRMIMIDPKQVELSVYNTIPHLLVPVVSDPRKAAGALAWVVQEMLERYGKFSAAGVRNLAGYNKANQGTENVLPNIVVIIDEMADLMEVCRKDVEESIRRLAALARAAGIYMVLATQRPSVDVITGVIKNNIPSRIAFAVSSGTDSRTIIDIIGAEKLMGKGDMLYKPAGASPQRVQGCLVTDDEVNAITEYIGRRYETNFDPNIAEHLESAGKEKNDAEDDFDHDTEVNPNADFDDLLSQAIEMAVEDGQTSTSMLQRRLRVGYARAGRLIDEMEKRGVISHSEGSKPRKTLITREQYYELFDND